MSDQRPEASPARVILPVGYRDADGRLHTCVTISRRPTGNDLLRHDSDPRAELPTFMTLCLLRASITGFGGLPCPLPIDALLALDSLDLDALVEAQVRFLGFDGENTRVTRSAENTFELAVGLTLNGLTYTRAVTRPWGRLPALTSRDLAYLKSASPISTALFMLGRKLAYLATDDRAHTLAGPLGVDILSRFDVEDLLGLLLGCAGQTIEATSIDPGSLLACYPRLRRGDGSLN